MSLRRKLNRQKRKGDTPEEPNASAPTTPSEESDPLSPEALSNASTPTKSIFPFDFPGHNSDWLKKKKK